MCIRDRVRTLESLLDTGALDQQRASVRAQVRQRGEFTCLIAQHDDGLPTNLDRYVLAGLGDLVGSGDENPVAAEDPFDVEQMGLGPICGERKCPLRIDDIRHDISLSGRGTPFDRQP